MSINQRVRLKGPDRKSGVVIGQSDGKFLVQFADQVASFRVLLSEEELEFLDTPTSAEPKTNTEQKQ